MSFLKVDDIPIDLTVIFLKLVGLWVANNRSEQRIRNITLTYTIIAILSAVWMETLDIYYSCGDFSACLYIACTTLSTIMPFLKILMLLAHKEDFFRLILYLKQKFLHADDYDDYEKNMVMVCEKKCTFFICMFMFFTLGTVIFYIINPIVANIGRNESERILPFNQWVSLPLSMTPYFEIAFTIQILFLYHIGISYFCSDNFLCIMNLHVANQFQVLQYRMANMVELKAKEKPDKNEKLLVNSCFTNECYTTFKKYIRQHQMLIAYCSKLEEIFNSIILEQVLMFSLLICLDGYQILMVGVPMRTRLIFCFHLLACFSQLLMFTYSCDSIVRESTKVANAVYAGLWQLLPMTTSGRMMRKDLILVIMRSGVPCCLSGKGFFTVSLETYTRVLSTAASYFTLLRQNTIETTS